MKFAFALQASGCALLLAASPTALAAKSCAAMAKVSLPGHSLKIEKSETVATVPAHCRLDGVIDPRVGHNSKPYGIGFSLALPKEWNGKFFFQGGGGLNGSINPPLGERYAGAKGALARGFAVVSTDSGHKGAGFDASFFEDQVAALNFLYQGVAKTTVVAKLLVAEHYGKPAERSYFVGCSTGGREGMMMSQRYPEYFDGIVAGAPAMRTNFSNLGLRWGTTALNAVAPKNAQGQPQPQLALNEGDRKLVIDGFLGACDALDGAKDGLVFATQACRFDPQVLACSGAKAANCLTNEQVAAVKKVVAGPVATDGRQVYPGYLYDTGLSNTRGLPGVLVGPVIPEGPTPGVTMDVDAQAAQAHDGRAMAGDTNGWTNLASFKGRGGKLIFFHGISDPWFSALDTVQYYQRLAPANAPTPLKDWSRLFLVPGMGHCAGGERTLDRFDMVDAIVNWVENGQAPERVVATGASMPGESRPLCPFPAHSQFDGRGDAKSAASYSCRE